MFACIARMMWFRKCMPSERLLFYFLVRRYLNTAHVTFVSNSIPTTRLAINDIERTKFSYAGKQRVSYTFCCIVQLNDHSGSFKVIYFRISERQHNNFWPFLWMLRRYCTDRKHRKSPFAITPLLSREPIQISTQTVYGRKRDYLGYLYAAEV